MKHRTKRSKDMGLERLAQKFGLPAIVDKLQFNDQDLLLGPSTTVPQHLAQRDFSSDVQPLPRQLGAPGPGAARKGQTGA